MIADSYVMANVSINKKHGDMYDQGESVVNIGFLASLLVAITMKS